MIQLINNHKNHITAISGALIVSGIALGIAGFADTRSVLFITATIIAGLPILISAIQALLLKAFSIELLVSIAVIGALFIREYTESAVVTFLFLFGAYLEARTLEKTRSSLKSLMDMAPREATVQRDGKIFIISVDDVIIGDKVIIRSGGKVPVDGVIVNGQADINEATVTGESMPVTKTENDRVYSGTILDSGFIEIIAEKVGDDTTFAKIIELVEEASEAKSKAARFLDKFANIYTPGIIVLSGLVFIITRNLHLSITFLVVACPGALVIGAPVSNVAGIGNGAKKGALIKGGDVMDRLSKVDTVVFDKTGTLTKGRPSVTDMKNFSELDDNEFLRLCAIAESASEHHLGKTIVKKAVADKITIDSSPDNFELVKGNGIIAKVGNLNLVIGNRSLMSSNDIMLTDEFSEYAIKKEQQGNTAVFAAIDGKIAGIFSIADQIREDAHQALSFLRKYGINKMIMLTGDNRHTAKIVGDTLALDEVYPELLPEEKVGHVKRLKREGFKVAMAGDGINDAPAIATADIGLAMGDGGTDVSMETADVVLMADRLMQFAHAYALSKATMRNMKQNIYFAVFIVFVLLLGVLFGWVHLASGMFIHEASILIVILNAMRLIKFKMK